MYLLQKIVGQKTVVFALNMSRIQQNTKHSNNQINPLVVL